MMRWLLKNRVAIVVLLNILLDLAAFIGGSTHGEDVGRACYTCLMLGLCTLPLTLLHSVTGRYALLAIFMGTYFMHFAAMDLQAMLVGELALPDRSGFVTPAEVAILFSGVLILGGYLLAAGVAGGTRHVQLKEWPAGAALAIGTGLWLAGACATVYYQIYVAPEKSNLSSARGLAAMGPMLTFVVMLGQMVMPVGLLIIAYAYSRYRGLVWALLMIGILVAQMIVGFVVDIKGLAFMPLIMVIVSRTLVTKRLPLGWVLAALASLVFLFPVFQAYRQVTGELGVNRLQALGEIGKVIDLALHSAETVDTKRQDERPQTFAERAYVKDNVEQVMAHVGVDLPFLHGQSLEDLPLSFVPRFLMPDKPHLAIGQLYTHLIGKSDLDTYISISHVGELYWNFGWPGLLLGMAFTGLLLGFTGTRFSLEQGATLTRVMVLLTTIQTLCLGFEGDISNGYSLWMRSLAAIFLLHLVFAKPAAIPPRRDSSLPKPVTALEMSSATPLRAVFLAPERSRFPNVMR